MQPEQRAQSPTTILGAALLLGGLLCAVVPGFFLVQRTGPCYDLESHGVVFARLSAGHHLPVPIVQNCDHAFWLFVLYYIGFLVCAAGTLLIVRSSASWRMISALTLFAMILTVAMPYFPNADPYAYALYAYEPVVLKQSPYLLQHVQAASSVGMTLNALFPEYRNPIRIVNYGPMFAAVNAALIGPFGFVSLKAMIYAERIFGALGVLVLALLLAKTRSGASSRQVFAAIALNPLLLFESVSFTHGDIIMLVFLAAAYL